MEMRSPYPQVTEVDLYPLSDSSWRVSDSRPPGPTALALLGFIDKIGDTYQVAVLGAPLVRTYFASRNEAVEFFAGHGRRTSAW